MCDSEPLKMIAKPQSIRDHDILLFTIEKERIDIKILSLTHKDLIKQNENLSLTYLQMLLKPIACSQLYKAYVYFMPLISLTRAKYRTSCTLELDDTCCTEIFLALHQQWVARGASLKLQYFHSQ